MVIRPFARSFHSIAFHYIEYMGVIGASLYPSFGAQKKWQSKWEKIMAISSTKFTLFYYSMVINDQNQSNRKLF